MRTQTIEKYDAALAELKSNNMEIHYRDMTNISRKYFGSFVVLHYLKKQGGLKFNPEKNSYYIRQDLPNSKLIELYAEEQHKSGVRASKNYRRNQKMNSLVAQFDVDFMAAFDSMNNVFSSYEFGVALKKLGDYEKMIRLGKIRPMLLKKCKSYGTRNMWVKKHTSANAAPPQPIIDDHSSDPIPYLTGGMKGLLQYTSESLVKELRERGFTVTCKKITEVEI